MVQLADIQRQVKELSEEDRKGLVAYLLHGFTGGPLGPDDEEVEKREAEMDSGAVAPICHAEFLAQVGRSAQ
jgi:transcriptional regulator of met regulon